MGESPKLDLPPTPNYYQNPLQQGDVNYQSGLGHDLTSGNFTGNLSWLNPTINNNNGQNALSYAQGLLQPQFRDTLQQINNNAAANNQLNSSTYTDALARSQSDLNSQYQSILSQQAINDSNQSNANRLSLFGQGLNTLQGAIGNEQQDTGSQNQFNLANYQNQVAAAIAQQGQQGGGVFGALSGALGGGLAGFATGGPIGAGIGALGGGLSGGLSSQSSNMGGQLLQAGAGIYGSNQVANRITGLNNATPGSSAFNSFTPSNAYYNPLYGALNTPGLYS